MLLRHLLSGWLALMLSVAANAQTLVTVERSFGYVLGDVVEQTIQLDARVGRVSATSLPKPGYQTSWLYLRRAELLGGSRGRRIQLVYQVLSSAKDVSLIYLPAVALVTDRRDANANAVTERIDAMPITVSPLINTPPVQRDGLGDLRPDIDARKPDSAANIRRLWWTIPVLLGLLALFAWRRNYLRRSARHLPFSYAARQLRQLGSDYAQTQGRQRAYRYLHQAFDATAGRSVLAEGVEGFLSHNPAFNKARTEIERFYQSSRVVFFSQTDLSLGADQSLDARDMRRIAATLAGIERSAV